MGETAEDTIFLVGEWSLLSDVIAASAALRFRVCGGMVPTLRASVPDGPAYRRWRRGPEYTNDQEVSSWICWFSSDP